MMRIATTASRFGYVAAMFFAFTFLGMPLQGEESAAVDFMTEIKPILESACVNCHNASRAEGDLRLDTRAVALEGGSSGAALVPGEPGESLLYTTTQLADDDDLLMPPETERLSTDQAARLKAWIEQGAAWPDDAVLKATPRISFTQHVQPILEQNCVSCHNAESLEGDYDLSTRVAAFETGSEPPAIVPFAAGESYFLTVMKLPGDDDLLMPPSNAGGPLAAGDITTIERWISQGAVWPDDVTLEAKEKPATGPETPDNRQLIEKIHALIVETAAREAESSKGEMSDYEAKVPRTGADYEMVAIPGGEFLMGSPEGEEYRQAQEGPATRVTVSPFWIGKYEVTWDEYEPYMITRADRFKWGARKDYDSDVHDLVDAVSQPTAPYVEMSFGMGQKGFPAISMTQHAASKYCQWLSAQTGHFYRLPTEAEWEYACRAGTETAYSFGDSDGQLGQYAWFYDNANEKYQKVGLKKPNPWGLYDMHGNVMEWCLDQYTVDYFEQIKNQTDNPLIRATKRYPRSVRGGSWFDDPEQLRSAFRRGSDASWKQQDPQLPKSIWYHTNAPWLGFRIVRPKEIPSVEEMEFYWNSASQP